MEHKTDFKQYENTQGKCPRCRGMHLNYEAIELTGDMCYYPYTCEDCGQQGEEWYNMEFAGHNVLDGEELVEL